ncbi:hypothetical protein [Cupriavidus plantarum]|uniref:hypothetical protein n=1 Tax=Cupriavidus plantarum TaxID=942865 RepID=UPI0015CBE95B|nr:hypothetical protein [Cupriavidus plantarum]NYI01281.1 hypothetical protein [Cupriavidus plantarum]
MDPISFEFVSVEEAKRILDGEAPRRESADWTERRDPQTMVPQKLSPGALRWLRELPAQARPLELFHGYPRIANQLAVLAANESALLAYLADLLIDRRGDRQGFPGNIAQELSRLNAYLMGMLPPEEDGAGGEDGQSSQSGHSGKTRN